MKVFRLLLVSVSLLGFSCERHEFDGPGGTRQLHEPHGPKAHSDDVDESAAH